jgi:hypothetical protein
MHGKSRVRFMHIPSKYEFTFWQNGDNIVMTNDWGGSFGLNIFETLEELYSMRRFSFV